MAPISSLGSNPDSIRWKLRQKRSGGGGAVADKVSDSWLELFADVLLVVALQAPASLSDEDLKVSRGGHRRGRTDKSCNCLPHLNCGINAELYFEPDLRCKYGERSAIAAD